MSLFAWDRFQVLRNTLTAPPFINLYAVTREKYGDRTANTQAYYNAAETRAEACVRRAQVYVADREEELKPAVDLLRLTRLFNPFHIKYQSPPFATQNDVNVAIRELCNMMPALQPLRDRMLQEVAEYVMLCSGPLTAADEDVIASNSDSDSDSDSVRDYQADADFDILGWWRKRAVEAKRLPSLLEGLKIVLTLHPTSAGAERVFSLVNAAYTSQQTATLDETMKTTISLQYNNRPPAKQNTRTNKSYLVTWEFIREYYAKAAAISRM